MGEINGDGDDDKKKWDDPNSDNDDEEALSLCDLPVLENNGEDLKNTENYRCLEAEDFDFFGSHLTKESEMCVADEVFFQGQILPLRLSVSSESGLLLQGIKQEEKRNSLNSRSESMERSSSSNGFTTSLSSRSNSTGSHNSTITSTTTTSTYKPKIRNQFHSHPSPKPQIISCSRPGNTSNRSRKSNIWGIFKVGLVRTPEIELQELKLRNNNNNKEKSFNSRSSSSNSSRKSDIEVKTEKMMKKMKDRFVFENCRCSVDAVETVVIIKKQTKNKKKIIINGQETKEEEEDVKEKEEMEKKEKQSKQALYHTRTFEWLKELSIADVPVEL